MQPDRKPARDIGLDITRIVAFVSVPCVHFFKDTQFYSTPVLGVRMYIMCVMRTMFMVCVPLFILLSGYLMSNRDIPLSRKGIAAHIAKAAKLFTTYALATVVILAYRRWGMKEDITLLKGLLNILDFQQYSWYVNMYLGLYLMMPFLNALWRALEGREAQRTLLGALLLLTVLPSVLNIYDFVTEGALLRPWLTQTRYGLHTYAMGSNSKSSEMSGVNVRRMKISTFTICGACCAVAAVFTVAYQTTAYLSLGSGMGFNAVAACVVGGVMLGGGKGDAVGAFLGAIFMTLVNNGMYKYGLDTSWQYVFQGAVILIAIMSDAGFAAFTARRLKALAEKANAEEALLEAQARAKGGNA